jgi:hypothetical protein
VPFAPCSWSPCRPTATRRPRTRTPGDVGRGAATIPAGRTGGGYRHSREPDRGVVATVGSPPSGRRRAACPRSRACGRLCGGGRPRRRHGAVGGGRGGGAHAPAAPRGPGVRCRPGHRAGPGYGGGPGRRRAELPASGAHCGRGRPRGARRGVRPTLAVWAGALPAPGARHRSRPSAPAAAPAPRRGEDGRRLAVGPRLGRVARRAGVRARRRRAALLTERLGVPVAPVLSWTPAAGRGPQVVCRRRGRARGRATARGTMVRPRDACRADR